MVTIIAFFRKEQLIVALFHFFGYFIEKWAYNI